MKRYRLHRAKAVALHLALVVLAVLTAARQAAAEPIPDVTVTVLAGPAPNPAFVNQSVATLFKVNFDPELNAEEFENTTIEWTASWVQIEGGNASGSATPDPDDEEVTQVSVSFAQLGKYRLTAVAHVSNEFWDEPGFTTAQASVDITVATIRITSVIVTTEHGLITDKTDNFQSGGLTYSNPDWRLEPPKDNPVSHTWDSKVTIELVLERPQGAQEADFDIAGSGLGDFEASDVSIGGGGRTVTIQATNKLPKEITRITTGISWTVSGNNQTVSQSTGPSQLYVTAGTPTGSNNQPTLKRMHWVVSLASGKTTEAATADVVGPDATSYARFDPSKSIFGSPPTYTTAWQIMDGNKGDCGTLATLMKLELQLLGVTGPEVRYVYARHESWTGLVGESPSYSLMEHRVPGNDATRLGFVSGAWNNYEGCCLYNGKWWMGGAGTYKTKPVDVLFQWANPNTDPTGNHQCYYDQQDQVVGYADPPYPD